MSIRKGIRPVTERFLGSKNVLRVYRGGEKVWERDPMWGELSSLGFSLPDKVCYDIGETFDPTGLKVTARYSGNKPNQDVTKRCTVSVAGGASFTEAGPRIVTISYTEAGVTAIQQFVVSAADRTPDATWADFIQSTASSQSLYWTQSEQNGVILDWGDGSQPESYAGTAKTENDVTSYQVQESHSYKLRGGYIVKLTAEDGVTWLPGVQRSSNSAYGFTGSYSGKSSTKPEMIRFLFGPGCTGTQVCSFIDCTSLTRIELPEGATVTGIRAFGRCTALETVVLPDSLTTIDGYAFADCTSLTSLAFLSHVTSIGEGAFGGCSGLVNAVIPEGVESIGHMAFQNCTHLTSVSIPASVSSFGTRVLYQSTAVTSLTVASESVSFKAVDNILFSKDGTVLVACIPSRAGSYAIPSGVERIEDYAFYYCREITDISFPSSVTYIGFYAFYYCSRLTELTVPGTVLQCANYAFAYCRALVNVELGAKEIGMFLFSSCTALEKVWIVQGAGTGGVAVRWNDNTNKPSGTPFWSAPSTAAIYIYVDILDFVDPHIAYFNYRNADNGLPVTYGQRTRPW